MSPLGLKNPRELESWSKSISLGSIWSYFDEAEPRLGWHRLLRYIQVIRTASWIAYYKFEEERAAQH